MLRRKAERVRERSGLPRGSHDDKALVEIVETYPRDELFQMSEDELYEIALGILRLGERRRVRLFVRRDSFGRFLSCLVYLPRERFHTENRRRIEEILQEAFGGVSADYTSRVSESVLARFHFVIYTEPGRVPEYDAAEIEARLAAATRAWSDDLREVLVEQLGEERGERLFVRYGEAFPGSYRDDFSARQAVLDVNRLEKLDAADLGMSLYVPLEAESGVLRFKVLRSQHPVVLSDVLPLLENMGVRVVDERPYEIRAAGAPPAWIYDFGLRHDEASELQVDTVRETFQDAFVRAWRGDAESDGFNRLVLSAQLTAREITILRAIAKYLRQAGGTFSQAYMERALAAHPGIARQLVELFRLRLDPARFADTDTKARALDRAIEETIDGVESLDEDRILRSFLRVVRAVLRTNFFQVDADGHAKPYLSLKLDPDLIPDLPEPRPMAEIFVYSPRLEAVHLRGGKVARGGIRWSDRREDFRTEVLGLMKAQTVKNAVIVPVGAKGGFVVKRPPTGDRAALLEEVVECYRTFMRGLLDVTDTLAAGEVVPPTDVVRHDGDDSYLVVAADKGTATFSDIANEISKEYGFWLGDAFASGGSAGYDHKKLGITARGAWESVKRHFRGLGTDVDAADFTVVGIGDMSGDVFGNGMLRSRHIKLVGAFDHRHVFLDPDPDPGASFAERERLFQLPGSSWADYDESLISAGGGAFPRTAKSIDLSPQARTALGVEAESLDAERGHPRLAPVPGRPALERRHRYVREGRRGTPRGGRRQDERRRPHRCRGAALPRSRRGREPRLHAACAGRLCAARRAHLHGRDRQLGRRRLLRPRGEHQDPARRSRRRGRSHREAAQRDPDRDGGRGGRARAARQLRAGPGDRRLGSPGRGDGRSARTLRPQPRAVRRAEPRARVPAERGGVRRA